MLKQIKKWGNSLVIVFTKEDENLYGIVEGEKIDLDFLEQELRKKKLTKGVKVNGKKGNMS